jgi:Domain of unknown function (DUF4148)
MLVSALHGIEQTFLIVCNTDDYFLSNRGNTLRIWPSGAGQHFLEVNMKSSIYAVLVVSVLAAPITSFAQQSEPITREQVRAELVQLQAAGYDAGGSDATYPANLQAALVRVNQQNQAQAQAAPQNSAYGTSSSGTSQAGRPQAAVDTKSIYMGQ